MTKVTLKLVVVLVLLTSVAVMPFHDFASANPYLHAYIGGGGYGLNFILLLTSPTNSSVFTSGNIPLTLIVGIQNIPQASTNIHLQVTNVGYVADWLNGTVSLDDNMSRDKPGGWITYLSCNLTLSEIPDGNHTLTVFAHEDGYFISGITRTDVTGYRNVTRNFVVDRPPTLSFLIPQNQTYPNGNVTLNFAADKPLFNVAYSLDNQDNITIVNPSAISFVNLSEGEHNVTVTAKDALGVASAPATVVFSVDIEEPAPSQLNPFILSVIALAVAAVIVLTGGLLLYRKRRRVLKQQTDF